MNWIDRATRTIAPRWTLRRMRARLAGELLERTYDAASSGRRTQGWRRSSADANASIGPHLARLRESARDLIRNNPYAESALSTIVDHTVGWEITAKANPFSQRVQDTWDAWAGTKACDADGIHDFAGLQKLVMRTVVESGEVFVRRRLRLPSDNLPIPLQIQVLEPDFLDTGKDAMLLPNGGHIRQGIEFDPLGKRAAYWMFREHPGSGIHSSSSSRIPADSIRHVFRSNRPGQHRGLTWYAPTLLRFKDLDDFEDATLMKQKIAACLAVITSDIDGTAPQLGTEETTDNIDSLEPGAILNVAAGRSIEVVQPPRVDEYADYTRALLRSNATGLGVTYEDMTGDYQDLPFSAARMSRLRHWARVDNWRWNLLIPQFCDPVWYWAMELAAIGQNGVKGFEVIPAPIWTPPPPAMVDPDKEGLAYQRNIRSGLMTWSEAVRERGYDPDTVLAEMAKDNEKFDKLGIVLDSDPRKMTQAGMIQAAAPASSASSAPPAADERAPGRAHLRAVSE